MGRFQKLNSRYESAYGSCERIQREKALVNFKDDLDELMLEDVPNYSYEHFI